MSLSLSQRALALILCVVMLMSGCAGALRPHDHGDPAAQDLLQAPLADGHTHSGDGAPEAQKVGRGREAALVFFGAVVVFLVLTDIFLLPAYHRRHNSFPCTRYVYRSCYHYHY